MKILDSQYDERLSSLSVMLKMTVDEYLALVGRSYSRHGIEGQRDPVSTASAVRIRARMLDDFEFGAILPPLVLGACIGKELVDSSRSWSVESLSSYIRALDRGKVAIIDGVQRTDVLRDSDNEARLQLIRVELWLVPQTSALTYRMLVLNTGQVPWNLRRQLEVVNAALIREIRDEMRRRSDRDVRLASFELFGIDEARRRSKAGQFQAHEVAELYMAFGVRKTSVDKETTLADQFARLDMVDAVSNSGFFMAFVDILCAMLLLDTAFGRLEEVGASTESRERRFPTGRSLFDSQPACVGFAAAASQLIYGRLGADKPAEWQSATTKLVLGRCSSLRDRLDSMTQGDLGKFLDLATLNEVMGQQVGKIGEFERAFFLEAFRLVLSSDDVASMTPAWRAH